MSKVVKLRLTIVVTKYNLISVNGRIIHSVINKYSLSSVVS